MKATALFILAAACTLFWLGIANAQDANYSITKNLPGMGEATVYTGAPAGFDPTTASDEELQTYGYPSRPDPNDMKAYAVWQRAVSTTRVTPELVPNPNRFHRPNQKMGSFVSGNWSGYSVVKGSPTFDEVVGLWIVPSVNSESGSFTGYSSMWVGIDGNCVCDDLVQDGTEQEWDGGKAVYYAWIEFIPNSELVASGFTVQPGDVIYATSSFKNGKGVYFVSNFNTNKSFSASLSVPKGAKFSGLSVEWIIERTEVGGSFSNPLPHYAYAYMDDAWAYRSGSASKVTYLDGDSENIVMEQGGTKLSKAYEQDGDSMWFEWLAYK